jgi:N-acetylgalactosamine-6-sulfatase
MTNLLPFSARSVLVALSLLAGLAVRAATPRPNIVFLLADDLGYRDIGCYGVKDIRTPAIDRLAQQGVRFTQFYATAVCTPSRTALLTGRYEQRVGGLETAIGVGNVGRYDDAVRLAATHDLGLPVSEISLARLLKDAGYDTALYGKWHLGYEAKFSPNRHGFDDAFYCAGGEMDYFHYVEKTPSGYDYVLRQNGRVVKPHGYFTDLVADKAVNFIANHRDRPFFLYVPFTAPHSPYQKPDDSSPQPLPPDSKLWSQKGAPPAVYRAMIERLDQAIGRILSELEQTGLSGRTLVIFASDNGGTPSCRPTGLSSFKGTTLEGGIRVPCIVRWPGKLPAGLVSTQPAIIEDLTVSLVNAAGAKAPAGRAFDGIDLLRRIGEHEPDISRTLFWRTRRYNGTWKAVRDGDLKYVVHFDGPTIDLEGLYNLATDAGEQHDLRSTRPADTARLQRLLANWEKAVQPKR